MNASEDKPESAHQQLAALEQVLSQVHAEREAMREESMGLVGTPGSRSPDQKDKGDYAAALDGSNKEEQELQDQEQGQQGGSSLEGWPQWLKDWQRGVVPHEQALQLQQQVLQDDQEEFMDDLGSEEQEEGKQAAGEAQQELNGGALPDADHHSSQPALAAYQQQQLLPQFQASIEAAQQHLQGDALMQILQQITGLPLAELGTNLPAAAQPPSAALPPLSRSAAQQAAPAIMLPTLTLPGVTDGLHLSTPASGLCALWGGGSSGYGPERCYPQSGMEKHSSGSGNRESEEGGGEDEGEEPGSSGSSSDGSSIVGNSTRRSSRRGRGRRQTGSRGGSWEQAGKVEGGVAKGVGIQRQRPAGGTSKRKGVTKHRHTLRWEAHLWDNSAPRTHVAGKKGRTRGKQVYLGGFASEDEAARAYDRAAIVYYGTSTQLNGSISDYEHELDILLSLTKEQVVAMLRRSSGFSRGYASRPAVEPLQALSEVSSPQTIP